MCMSGDTCMCTAHVLMDIQNLSYVMNMSANTDKEAGLFTPTNTHMRRRLVYTCHPPSVFQPSFVEFLTEITWL
jgi:hypothetical protein